MNRRTLYTCAGVALVAFGLVAPFAFTLPTAGALVLAFGCFVFGAALAVHGQKQRGGRRRYRGGGEAD